MRTFASETIVRPIQMIQFNYNDGGREAAGFKGNAGDCVTRAIAIATEKPYNEVYEALYSEIKQFSTGRSRAAKRAARGKGLRGTTPRNGVNKKVYKKYLESLGWQWIPTMFIGQGCKVHLRADELPDGKIICRLSKHLTAVINGVVNDIYNPAREIAVSEFKQTLNEEQKKQFAEVEHKYISERCVYGYFQKK